MLKFISLVSLSAMALQSCGSEQVSGSTTSDQSALVERPFVIVNNCKGTFDSGATITQTVEPLLKLNSMQP